jgi:hypothetical protein
MLDRKNPSHLWLLHRLFLKDINDDCKEFQDQWNAHPISGPQTKDRSPAVRVALNFISVITFKFLQDLRFLGQMDNGVYTHDPTMGIHPEILNRYYGVDGHVRARSDARTGAGHPEDEGDWANEDSDDNENSVEGYVQNCIAEDQAANIRHAPVKVARHANPFHEGAVEDQFYAILNEVRSNGLIPEGYGVLDCEWENMCYPEVEVINLGPRGKEIVVALPKAIWLSRAILFVQGLDVMTRMLIDEE